MKEKSVMLVKKVIVDACQRYVKERNQDEVEKIAVENRTADKIHAHMKNQRIYLVT